MAAYKDLQKASVGGRLQFLFKDTLIYGCGGAFAKLFSLLTVPILTRILSQEQYGAIDGIAVFAAVFAPIMIMGMDSAIARFFYETDDKRRQREIVSQGLLIELALAVLVCASVYAQSEVLLGWFLDDVTYAPVFRIAVISVFFSVLVMFSQNLLKWTLCRNHYLLMSLGSSLLTVFLTVLYVWWFGLGVTGVFVAQLCSNIVFAALGMLLVRGWITVPSNMKHAIPLLAFGWPAMLVGLASALVPSIDRYFILNCLGLELLAVYSVSLKVSAILQLPVTGFQTAWGPFAFAIYKEPSAGQTYDRVFLYFAAFLTAVALLLVIAAEPLVLILASSKYLQSTDLVTPLVFAIVVESVSTISGIGIGLSKKTVYTVVSYGITLAVSLACISLLIGPFGLRGVVYAVLLSRMVLAASRTFFAYRSYPIRFSLRPVMTLVAGGFVSALVSCGLDFIPWYVRIVVGMAMLFGFVWVAWRFFAIQEDKKLLLQMARRVTKRRS